MQLYRATLSDSNMRKLSIEKCIAKNFESRNINTSITLISDISSNEDEDANVVLQTVVSQEQLSDLSSVFVIVSSDGEYSADLLGHDYSSIVGIDLESDIEWNEKPRRSYVPQGTNLIARGVKLCGIGGTYCLNRIPDKNYETSQNTYENHNHECYPKTEKPIKDCPCFHQKPSSCFESKNIQHTFTDTTERPCCCSGIPRKALKGCCQDLTRLDKNCPKQKSAYLPHPEISQCLPPKQKSERSASRQHVDHKLRKHKTHLPPKQNVLPSHSKQNTDPFPVQKNADTMRRKKIDCQLPENKADGRKQRKKKPDCLSAHIQDYFSGKNRQIPSQQKVDCFSPKNQLHSQRHDNQPFDANQNCLPSSEVADVDCLPPQREDGRSAPQQTDACFSTDEKGAISYVTELMAEGDQLHGPSNRHDLTPPTLKPCTKKTKKSKFNFRRIIRNPKKTQNVKIDPCYTWEFVEKDINCSSCDGNSQEVQVPTFGYMKQDAECQGCFETTKETITELDCLVPGIIKPAKPCTCKKCKGKKKKKNVTCECQKAIKEDENARQKAKSKPCQCPNEKNDILSHINDFEWVDRKYINNMKSNLSTKISGFKMDILKKIQQQKHANEQSIPLLTDDLIKAYEQLLLETAANKSFEENCSCEEEEYEQLIDPKSITCACQANESNNTLPYYEEIEDQKEPPLKGFKIGVEGKGSASKGLDCCVPDICKKKRK